MGGKKTGEMVKNRLIYLLFITFQHKKKIRWMLFHSVEFSVFILDCPSTKTVQLKLPKTKQKQKQNK